MQRRAAAAYFALFLVLAAGGFAVISVAQPPQVDAPGRTVGSGATFQEGGQTYRVQNVSVQQVGDGHGGTQPAYFGRIAWTEEDARFTASVENNTTVDGLSVQWSGIEGRFSATLTEGDTVRYQGNQTTVEVNENNVTLRAGPNTSTTVSVGGTLAYQGHQATLAGTSGDTANLEWADDYRVLTPNATDPDEFTFRQEFNVSAILRSDPAVENETVTRADGNRYVVYESNGSTAPLDDYLPDPERRTFAEGDSLTYEGNQSTVANVTNTSVTLSWTADRQRSVALGQDTNVTLGNTTYTAYYTSQDRVLLANDYGAYQNDLSRIEYYNERITGLWGVVDLGLLAAIVLLAAAYMPVRG